MSNENFGINGRSEKENKVRKFQNIIKDKMTKFFIVILKIKIVKLLERIR